MLFGRVEAVAIPMDDAGLIRITVYLETGHEITVVRDEPMPILRPIDGARDRAWHADQDAQETIANELAFEGWEVIGGGEIPEPEVGEVAKSATYAVRRIGVDSWQ
jgi:hypothetical protein